MKKKVKVQVIPGIVGTYGERVLVKNNDREVYNFFKLVSIWTSSSTLNPDGTVTTLFELPMKVSCFDDFLSMILRRLNAEVVLATSDDVSEN